MWLPTNLVPTNTPAHPALHSPRAPLTPTQGSQGGKPGKLGEAHSPHALTYWLCPQTRLGLPDRAPSSKKSQKPAAGPGLATLFFPSAPCPLSSLSNKDHYCCSSYCPSPGWGRVREAAQVWTGALA